jgi:hypothetical protein
LLALDLPSPCNGGRKVALPLDKSNSGKDANPSSATAAASAAVFKLSRDCCDRSRIKLAFPSPLILDTMQVLAWLECATMQALARFGVSPLPMLMGLDSPGSLPTPTSFPRASYLLKRTGIRAACTFKTAHDKGAASNFVSELCLHINALAAVVPL